jgi:perosamine synthetase
MEYIESLKYFKNRKTGRKMIPYGRQTIEEDDIQAVVDVLRSDYLTTGPKISEFEKMVADYVGAKYAVAISNGTSALHAACFAAGIQAGDEVITTPLTFAASTNCVLYCGGTPVFADVDPKTYNIDPEDIRRKITDKTKAIIAVHLAGQPCDMDEIHKIAKEHNLLVIEDGAHALGSVYKGKKVGTLSDMTTFSFHPVKPITTGEGGMIVTDNEEFYKKMMLFRSHGITRDENLMTRNDGPWFYQQLDLGYNYRITDIQCALGCSQMKKLDRFLSRRKEIVARYNEAFADCENIVTPYQLPETESGWHLYIVQVKNCDRRKVFEALREQGIAVNVHYIPVYMHPYYQEHGYKEIHCRKAEEVYSHIISLPLYPTLTEEQQEFVIQGIMQCVEHAK